MARRGQQLGTRAGPSASLAGALTAALPEKAALDSGLGLATRFWGGLVDAGGKVSYESTSVRVGRKRRPVVSKVRLFGQEKTVDRSGDVPVVTTHHEIARWEFVPLFVVGAGVVAATLAETERGTSFVGKVKDKTPQLWYGKTKGGWGPISWNIANFRGGIHVPY